MRNMPRIRPGQKVRHWVTGPPWMQVTSGNGGRAAARRKQPTVDLEPVGRRPGQAFDEGMGPSANPVLATGATVL